MNHLKKILFIIITLTSLLISIKLSKMPLFRFMKNDSFFYTSQDIIEKYSFIYDISIGLFLSNIFYIIIEYIPAQKEISNGKHVIQNSVNLILEKLVTIIGLICQLYGVDNNSELFEKDFLITCGDYCFNDAIISYHLETFSLFGKRITGVHSYNTFQKVISSCIKAIKKEIENIKKISIGYKFSTDFLKVLSKVETNAFLRLYENEKLFIYANSDSLIFDLYRLYLEFLKTKYHSKITKIRLDRELETKEYLCKVNSGDYFSEITDYRNKKNKWSKVNQPIIIFDKNDNNYYVAKYVINNVFPNIKAIELTEIDEDMFSNSCLVIDITTKNKINNYRLLPNSKVFCFCPRGIKKKNSNSVVVTYKKPFTILNKHINGNHPNRKDIDILIRNINEFIDSELEDKY